MAMRLPESEKTVTMWKTDEASFEQLAMGKKKIEVKIATAGMKDILEQSLIIFFGHSEQKFLIVQRSKKFKDFEDMLKTIDASAIYPDKDAAGALKELRTKFPRSKEHYGVYAFELTPYVQPKPKASITYATK